MLLVYVALQGQLLLSCLSSASLTLAIQDPTGRFVFAPDVRSVIRFSLSGFSREEEIHIYVHHKPGNTSDYTTLCYVHQQREICTPDPVDVCQCLTREPNAAKYEIRKVFRPQDSGVLRFRIWGDSRRHEETFNITIVSTSSHGATVAFMSTDTPDVQNFTTEGRGLSSGDNDDSSSSNVTNVINITVIASCLAVVVSACVVFVVAARCFLKRPGTAPRTQQENFASGNERTNSQTGNPGLVSSSFSGGECLLPGQYEHAWYSAKAEENAYTEIDTCGHGTYLSVQELRSEHSEPG